jgi:hypothetical protein
MRLYCILVWFVLSLSSLAGGFSNDVNNWQASHRYYFAGVGDSIMVGHGGAICGGEYETALGGGPYGNTNMNILNKLFLMTGANGTNCGHGGYNWRETLTTGLPWATNSDCKYILFHCGINDIAQSRTWLQVSNDMNACKAMCAAASKTMVVDEIFPDGQTNVVTDTLSLIVRQWNTNYHIWGKLNNVPIMTSHNLMGQIRASTGELDDLNYAYSSSGGRDVHLCVSGVNVWATNIVSFFNGLIVPAPLLTNATMQPGGAFQFGFTNMPGASFTVLATTNVGLALDTWTALGPAFETSPGPGHFQFIDLQATNSIRRFYLIRSP